MNREIPQEDLNRIFSYHHWRQRIQLTDSFETPGRNFANEWDSAMLPKSMQGLSFLDVGSNDGMFSFLAEKKGAQQVYATDIYTNEHNSHMVAGWNNTGVTIARDVLRSKVKFHNYSIYELDKIEGKFDYVYCANVIAWLRDPLTALEQLASKAKGTLHLREDISSMPGSKPALEMVHSFKAGSATCYYNPNKAWFTEVLLGLGFKEVTIQAIDEEALLKYRNDHSQLYAVPAKTPIVTSPIEVQSHGAIESDRTLRSTFEYSSYCFFPSVGWIAKSDISPIESNFLKSSPLKNRLKQMMGKPVDWPEINFAIIAKR